MTNPIYTIGYSNREWPELLALLREHGITAVCDVRSHPYSQFNPQFNRETIGGSLKTEGIAYIHLGRELGGRPEDEGCYEHGKVLYERVAQSELFKQGMTRLLKGRETHRLVLLCAEKDPLDCHRMFLIARQLEARGILVHHILENGKCETQEQTLDRLLERQGLSPAGDLLPKDEAIEAACSAQADRIAHKKKSAGVRATQEALQ